MIPVMVVVNDGVADAVDLSVRLRVTQIVMI